MLVVHSNRSGWRSIKRAVRHRNLVAIAPRLGEPSRCFRFAFLVSEAARLRHGRDTAVSRPGLQLGRAGDAISPASQSGHLREPSLALTRPWSPIGFGSRQVTRFAQIASSPLPHCSARARRQTHQLCARSTRCRTQLRRLRWMLSLVPTSANWRDCRRRHSCAPNKKESRGRDAPHIGPVGAGTPANMAARLRPARTQQYGARLRLSPRTSALTVSTARFAPASQNTPTSLTKPSWSETSPPGCGRCCRSRPCTHRVAALALRSAVEDSDSLACAIATAPGTSPADPAKGIGCAAGCHERPARLTVLVPARLWPRLAPRCYTQHILCVRSLVPRSLLYSEPRRHSSLASRFGAGIKIRTIWRCVTHRCCTVTLIASRIPHPARDCPRRVAISAPACRHRSRQRSRFA